jgi:LAO/AO transport system kinase
MHLEEKILKGDRAAIAKAITLVESSREQDQKKSRELISKLVMNPGHSVRVGFSGSPGVGKSTFIESFGSFLVKKGYRLGILAIDPSSQITGGSILGDKTRMHEISKNENTFIRSTPSKGALGGVSFGTREAAIILDSAGYDFIFIETVGVGQSEIMAANLVDIFSLIVGPGSGDELQGIKKGITEYADIFIVNKNDGDLSLQASKTASDYKSALSYYSSNKDSLDKEVLLVSSLEQTGMEDVTQAILNIIGHNKNSTVFDERRYKQLSYWIKEELRNRIHYKVESEIKKDSEFESMTKKILNGEDTMHNIIDQFLEKIIK